MTATTPKKSPDSAWPVIGQAVLAGMLVMLAGTLPRNILFVANLRFGAGLPWAVPVMAVYLWYFWRFLQGAYETDPAASEKRGWLRAHHVSGKIWVWAFVAGGLGIVALVQGLQLVNRLVELPVQRLPDFGDVPRSTVLALLLFGAPVAGIVEEAAFRGYMQGPIERRCGLSVAILITGTMFAVAHLDFTPVLWPYYVTVAAIYGVVTNLTGSILPAVVLHTAGNLYSNLDLWRHGRAEWQAPAGATGTIWAHGPDAAFWISCLWFGAAVVATVGAYVVLAGISRKQTMLELENPEATLNR